MLNKMKSRVGPVGLSLVAAALTATAFAAVSVAAKDDNGTKDKQQGPDVFRHAAPGAPPQISEEDQQAMEEFRQCMEDNGAPAPPEPPAPGEEPKANQLPEPPTEAEQAEIEKAMKACEDKLPEGARVGIGPGGPGGGPCPPPGAANGEAPAPPRSSGENQSQAAPSSGSSSAVS